MYYYISYLPVNDLIIFGLIYSHHTEYYYSTLAKLAKAILVIPHGNADTEHLFSHIGLNKTKHRNRLGIFTLILILTVQFNVPQKCYEFKPNTELLKTCVNAMNTL